MVTQPASNSIDYDGYRRLYADITDAPSAAPETPRTCPDCGGPVLPTITQRASGLGPGPVLLACQDKNTLPWLPVDSLRARCGAPNAVGRLWLAWQDAQDALRLAQRHLRVYDLTTIPPTARQLAELRGDAWLALDAQLAAEAAYTRAVAAAQGWTA